MRKLILLACLPMLAQSPAADERIAYLKAHAKALEAAAAINKINLQFLQSAAYIEYSRMVAAASEDAAAKKAVEAAARDNLAKKLGCADGIDEESLQCKEAAPLSKAVK